MHCLYKLFVAALLALPLVAAAGSKCNVTLSSLSTDLSGNQTAVMPPSNATVIAITLGVGTQNYTCQSSKWVNVGAVAALFDISCLQTITPVASMLPAAAFALHTQPSTSLYDTLYALAQIGGFQLYNHYFDTSTGTLSPVFNAAVSGGGFMVGKKIVDIPAATDPAINIDWLQLTNVSGNAANFVVRENTAGGQPPQSNCTIEGEALQVPYSGKYWFFKTV